MSDDSRPSTVPLFGMNIHAVKVEEAHALVHAWAAGPPGPLRYVVTPNVQHTMVFQEHPAFREAYAAASLVIADGWPLVASSRLLGTPLPERVTGSDLLPALCERARADRPLSVFLLGAKPGVGQTAAAKIEARWPHARVVGTRSPPLGFESDARENESILAHIAETSPDVLVVGLGAPKQELWTYRFRAEIRAKVALCLGGTIDFLAGATRRAPTWAQRAHLEWLHRALSEPRRLGRRYAEDAVSFPALVARTWLFGGRRLD
ncbi:MAG TPA: WecB/TagA/CpsF family glycosyltransferase [Polyangiaceae bacterium]|nr:WecB/TagA/CpsF family glycosyltransferase [Polyangiaceae bacterium]